ncbi:MAG: hypothetical protein JWO17_1164 [Actinomycetia bacterium]|nr:hypothetical protein [Actinomycetes bacterium]
MRRRGLLVTLGAGFAALVPPAFAFAPFETYPVGAEGQAVAIADVTGDKHNDVLMTDQTRLFVFRANANGKLAKPVVYPTAGPGSNEWNGDLAVADLNGDGRLDAAVADKAGVQIFLQRGGRFAAPKTIALPFIGASIAAADVDGDRRPDLVVSGRSDQDSSIVGLYLLSNRRSGWHLQKLDARWFSSIRLVDITGDGKLDIVPLPPGNVVPPSVRLYLGNGRGGFTQRDLQVGTENTDAPAALVAGDVTGDRRNDLVFVNEANKPWSHLAVMSGGPGGDFAAPKVYPSLDMASAVAVADLNGDHRNDVVVLHGFKKLGVYYQSKDGTLAAEQLTDLPYSTRYDPNGVAVGKIGPGAHPDVAIADNGYTKGLVVVRQP